MIDYCTIIRSAPELYVILSPDTTIIDASDAYLAATMVTREDIIGCDLFDIFPDNPDTDGSKGSAALRDSIQTVLKTKQAITMPTIKYDIRRPLSKGGTFETRYWSTAHTPILDEQNNVRYILTRIEDITEVDKLRSSDVENSKRLELLIENIKDYAVIMLDKDRNVTTWNDGAETIIGYHGNEVIGKPISLIYPDEYGTNYEYELNIAKEKGGYEAEGWRVRKNGGKFWARIVITPIYIKSTTDPKSNLIGYAKVIRDLSPQKEMETVKNGFISVINHELRTPLTSIFGAIRLLLNWSEHTAQNINYLLEIANANCERLLLLINDILDVEKLATSGMTLHVQVVELNPLIGHAVSINRVYGEHLGVEIIFSPLTPDVRVNVDSSRLTQVLTNLISNAVKFSEKNRPVQVVLSKHNNIVRIAVKNQGKGIPERFRNKIFEKFSQIDVSTTRKQRGTGLGLAISQEIVKQFGSTIEYTSVLNEETVFYFDLPLV